MKIIKIAMMFFITSLTAQSNYVSGTVTTKNNQVLNGEIDYQDWRKTPETISFKQGDNIRTYKPEDLVAFEVEGDKFISRHVTLDVTEQRLQYMNKTTRPRFEDIHVFLIVLVDGDLDLYEYNNIRPHYFYGKDGETKELIYRQSFSNDNGELFKLKQYIGQLNLLMNTCESVNPDDRLDYKRKELVKIVSEYNNCVTSDVDRKDDYVKNMQKVKNRFYGTAGYYFSNFKINTDAYYLEDFDKGSVSRFSFGVAYEIILSKNLGKWSMFTELTYSQVSGELNNDVPYSLTNTFNPLSVNHSTMDLSLLFRYSFVKPDTKLTPFINFGVGRSQTLSEDFYVTRNNTFNGSSTDIELETISGYFNYVLGAGVKYNKFTAELRYILSDKIINESGSNGMSNIGLMVAYQIF